MDSLRLGRLKRDLPWLGAALLAYLGTYGWLVATPSGRQAQDLIDAALGRGSVDLLQMRALGLLVFGLVSLLHARERRAMQLMAGLQSPNGIWLGVLAIGGGCLAHYFLLRGLSALP